MNLSTRDTNARRSAAAAASLALSFFALPFIQGCANGLVSDAIAAVTPYKVEIVQGNVVTREQIALLKPGMTRDQVRDVLGAPMLTDIFHAERWDYPFAIRRQGSEVLRRSVVVRFAGNVVKVIEAPDLPSEREFVAGLGAARPVGAAPKLELSEEERAALPTSKGTTAATAPTTTSSTNGPPAVSSTATGPKRDYPPLEPAR